MRPLLHPRLVNGRSGDPALYIESLFEKQTLLFDLGDITSLSPRNIQRIERVCISHAHLDHFVGFDRLLRVLVGRDKKIHLYGPPGLIEHVCHKLKGYSWNLADRYACDLIFVVTEIDSALVTRTGRFRLKHAFAPEAITEGQIVDGVVCRTPSFRISTAVLDHHIPCLAFAVEEAAHINVWKNRLVERNLSVGPWLRELKTAVIESRSDDYPVRIRARTSDPGGQLIPLGELRELVTVTPGQKIGYVTDAADTVDNRAAIIKLVQGADMLFIEAAFAQADAAAATARAHLTTAAAGQIARAAGVRRVEPFHFSARYAGEDERMLKEVQAAFAGQSLF